MDQPGQQPRRVAHGAGYQGRVEKDDLFTFAFFSLYAKKRLHNICWLKLGGGGWRGTWGFQRPNIVIWMIFKCYKSSLKDYDYDNRAEAQREGDIRRGSAKIPGFIFFRSLPCMK